MPRISPGAQRERDALRRRPTERSSTSSADGAVGAPAPARTAPASCSTAADDRLRAASAPSMCSTIVSSPPSCGTIVATAPPSRRIVARSQAAITSLRRCVMKSTERPRSRDAPHDREHALGEIRRQRGGDLVEQQQLRVARERAREVDHAQQRQRHVARRAREKSTSRSSARSSPRTALGDRAGQAHVLRDRQVGHERRDPGTRARARCARPAPASRSGPALPLTATVPRSAAITPVSILTSVLLPAPFAPSSACTSPGSTTRSAERRAHARGRSSSRGRVLRGVRSDVGHRRDDRGRGRRGPLPRSSAATAPCRPSAVRSCRSSTA